MARCTTCHRRLASGRPCPAHGGEAAPSAQLDADPAERPSWRPDVGPCLGRGGFASVWEVECERVIKVAHADHDLARARMAREAEALAAIGAPAVPALHARGVTDGRAWLVMDRVRGENLGDATLEGAMRADRAVRVTMALLDALVALHAAGFVHRDLKPDNLVRRSDGRVVILDLGIARKLPADPDDPTRAGVQVGSLEYMPPEQARDAATVDVRADLYAVGCILFELCTARPPFVGDAAALERAHAALRPPRMSELAPVPAVLELIVADCLAKDPAKRPRSALDLRARLLATRDTPSLTRSVPQLSQVTESKQPVVLVWAELPKVDRALLGQFTARRVLVVSQRGRKILGALLGSAHQDPATVALALAHDLESAGAKVVLHLDALHVETMAGTWKVRGDAVETPEGWLPTEPWTGTVLTRAIAAVAQTSTRASMLGPQFRVLVAASDESELVGRDAMLVDLAADAAAALRGAPSALERSQSGTWLPMGPAFALLYGEAGVGKSVFAAELGRRIRELGGQVVVTQVPPPGMVTKGPLDELVGRVSGVRAVGDALREHARRNPLAVILDDLHYADHDLLEALEYATLGGEPLPLWVLGIADPRLGARRPQLGTRAERHRKDTLHALDEDAAVELATKLLQPAAYPPLRAVRRLVGLARRNPLHLTMLAREIHERGAIRSRPGSSEHFLDTSALDTLEPIALGPWTAARATEDLAAELVSLARMCAVIGAPIETKELAAVIDAVEDAGGATTLVDPEVGLRELIAARVLVATPQGAAFRQPLVEEGLYATTDPSARRAIHAAALATLPVDANPARIARHAEAAGATQRAAEAYAQLGEQAERAHHPLEAADAWMGALRHVPAANAQRARALLGLAHAQTRSQRLLDALRAADEVVTIARAIDAPALAIDALLASAIAHDFLQDFPAAATSTTAARALLAPDAIERLVLGVELAEVRVSYRDQQFDAVAPRLRAVAMAATRGGPATEETATIASLLLGCALSDLGMLDEAERVFANLIEHCTQRGDRFHLAAAFGNRAWLWSARGEIARTADDLRAASQFARESGQAVVERAVTHNLAEQRLWIDSLDEALQLARRSLALQQRSGEGSTSLDRLLLARVFAARGELVELRDVLATFDGATPIGEDDAAGRSTLAVLRAFIGPTDAVGWERVLAAVDDLYPQLRLELWQLALRRGQLSDIRRRTASEVATQDPLWRHRAGIFGVG